MVSKSTIKSKPKTGNKGNPEVINTSCVSFKVEDIPPPQRDKFKDVKEAIYNLEVEGCITVSNKNTSLDVYQLQRKITSIIFCHRKKFVNKNFTTSIVDDENVRCWRTEDKKENGI